MCDDKVECMKVARKYEEQFWDGDRRYGYGGYKYDGRWRPVAQSLIDYYKLKNGSKILDVGCGKGFLLYEFTQILPEINVKGFDISKYAINNSKEEIREFLDIHKAQDLYPFNDHEFDLVISLTTLHNFNIMDLKASLAEIQRVGKNGYIVVESYRNETELFNLQCWALTCESFFSPAEWQWLFKEFGYSGDYEFIFFE
jgi:ubiquinone/menaquinone biosynthesis C-methylase UbiE